MLFSFLSAIIIMAIEMKIIIIILFIILIIWFIIGFYFFNFSEYPKFSQKKLFKKNTSKLVNEEDKNWFIKVNKKDIIISSDDNIFLHGYEIANKSHYWIIIVHGYTNSALDMLNYAKHFYQKNMNVILIDQRAHGKSGGKYSSMGWIERKDIINWISYINKKDKNAKIILFGISMGAHTVMMASGEKLPLNVKGIIEDSGFISIYKQFANQLKYLKFLPKPIIYFSHFFGMAFIKFNIYKENGIKQLKQGTIPMLFIHGSKDRFVPLNNYYEAYEVYGGKKEQLLVENAKHMQAAKTNPQLYYSKIDSFIKNNISK
jgi:fermentation-respiration switch protein FrsA (DUF1100 family)